MVHTPPVKRKIDSVMEAFYKTHQSSTNKTLSWLAIPLLALGFLGMIWAVPFPQLDFLGRYNGFVNWASFVIAFTIYYYYRMSPVLSYGILLIVFAFSAGIVGLEKLHRLQGWPPMGMVCSVIFILGLVLQLIGYKAEGKMPGLAQQLKSLLYGPLWLMYMFFEKLGVKG